MNSTYETLTTLFTPFKGILANDASPTSLEKRFAQYNTPFSPQTRQDFRNIFYTSPQISTAISGVILNEEAVPQKSNEGIPFTEVLKNKGVVPGVKVDTGLKPFGNGDKEYTTGGIDDLESRLRQHIRHGVRFTKWRAAFIIGSGTPSTDTITENIRLLLKFGEISQDFGLVPILETEVLMEGHHSIKDCARATETIITELVSHDFPFENAILKTNMVLSGIENGKDTPDEVAQHTTDVLLKSVPKSMGGVVFLSGGQTPQQAVENLGAIVKHGPFPWPLTFSFERVFEIPVLETWKGKQENVQAAQDAFQNEGRLVSATLKQT